MERTVAGLASGAGGEGDWKGQEYLGRVTIYIPGFQQEGSNIETLPGLRWEWQKAPPGQPQQSAQNDFARGEPPDLFLKLSQQAETQGCPVCQHILLWLCLLPAPLHCCPSSCHSFCLVQVARDCSKITSVLGCKDKPPVLRSRPDLAP